MHTQAGLEAAHRSLPALQEERAIPDPGRAERGALAALSEPPLGATPQTRQREAESAGGPALPDESRGRGRGAHSEHGSMLLREAAAASPTSVSLAT